MLKQHALRIFIVDDERVIAATLAIILRSAGYNATFFTDPLEALRSSAFDYPDLLISDVLMPGLSGVNLAILMQQRCPDCEILLFSGQACTQDLLVQARAQGHVFPLLSKPVHPTEILRWVKEREQRAKLSSTYAREPSPEATRDSFPLLSA
jgi:CheY-like chemotaxis protein